MADRGEFAKYLVLGGINFLLTLAVFKVLLESLGIHYNLSLFGSWFVGMVFMYVMNFVWVFGDQGALQFDARFLKFLLVGIVSITCNMAVLSLIVSVWATDPFWTQILLLPAIVAFNFLAMKYFSFALDAKAAHEKARQR